MNKQKKEEESQVAGYLTVLAGTCVVKGKKS